jgi:HEPN domain-containing protein
MESRAAKQPAAWASKSHLDLAPGGSKIPLTGSLMPPTTSRDFLKAAAQRLTAAEVLFRQKHNLDAQYLAGYAVECSLKGLILHHAPIANQSDVLKRITGGAKMHRAEVLLGELRTLGIALPVEIAKRMRRFDWTTDLRYETGRRRTGETLALLKTTRAVYNWAEGQIP